MAQIGGSIEEMRQLQAAFAREAGTVQQLAATVTSQVTSTWWVGPAAERFREQWNSEFRPVLLQLHEALGSSSQEIGRHAEALTQAGG
jgi:WXG100 family type VII secretion target